MGIELEGGITNKVSDIAKLKLQNMKAARSTAFANLLKNNLIDSENKEIKFSKHASIRMEERGIKLSDSFLYKLKRAIDKADDKGAKDIVVMSDKGAFIVNVPNRTVITGITESEMKENIFTNIDSAMVL